MLSVGQERYVLSSVRTGSCPSPSIQRSTRGKAGPQPMDPDANLREQRDIAADILRIQDACTDDGCFNEEQELALVAHAQRLAELVQALDGWLTAGGTKPQMWTGHLWGPLEPRR